MDSQTLVRITINVQHSIQHFLFINFVYYTLFIASLQNHCFGRSISVFVENTKHRGDKLVVLFSTSKSAPLSVV